MRGVAGEEKGMKRRNGGERVKKRKGGRRLATKTIYEL